MMFDCIKNLFKKEDPEKDEVIKSAEQLAEILKEATGKDIPVFKIDMPNGYRGVKNGYKQDSENDG